MIKNPTEDDDKSQPLVITDRSVGREVDLKSEPRASITRKKKDHVENPQSKTVSTWGLYIVLFCLIFVNFGSHVSFDTHQLLEDYFLIHFDI